MVHASAMGMAFLLFVAREVLFISAWRGQIRAAKVALIANKLAGLLIGIGIAGGIALVILGSWPILTPWLLTSFTLIAILMAVERKFVGPWTAQVHPALLGSDKWEVQRFFGDKRALCGRLTTIGLFALLIALMTIKPDLAAIFGA